eukprot:TRINITY_DN8805_c0_g1_i5.p2 TRINITY_DN8805_c0_g1~~TRINITY_DN8805_c0_g1_i5.p2  ORF type:complete len:115 (+),score=7.30 TRINITY_DN8805_c0_g1_i5:135-479(+)
MCIRDRVSTQSTWAPANAAISCNFMLRLSFELIHFQYIAIIVEKQYLFLYSHIIVNAAFFMARRTISDIIKKLFCISYCVQRQRIYSINIANTKEIYDQEFQLQKDREILEQAW